MRNKRLLLAMGAMLMLICLCATALSAGDDLRTLKSGKKPTVSGEYGKEIIRVVEHVYNMNV